MNISPKNFLDMLQKAAVGGLNKDCVINSTPEGSAVITLDESQTVYCHAYCNESIGTCEVGIGRLDILIRFLSGLSCDTISANVQDNRLVFTDESTNFRYLLSDPKSIRSQLDEPPTGDEDYQATYQECPFSIELKDEDRAYFVKMMGTTKPRAVTIKLSKSGRVTIVGGSDNEHTFDKVIGNATIAEDSGAEFHTIEAVFYGESMKHIFDQLTLGVRTTMLIADDGSSCAFMQDGVLYNVRTLSE